MLSTHAINAFKISGLYYKYVMIVSYDRNRTACIRHQCKKTIVLSCHRCIMLSTHAINAFKISGLYYKHVMIVFYEHNRTVLIRHQCKKITVLSCHRCIINNGVEKMNNIKIKIIILTTGGLYYKHITIVNDDSSIINKWLESFTDDTRVIVQNHNMFIILATDVYK